jgi:hypothetical protein
VHRMSGAGVPYDPESGRRSTHGRRRTSKSARWADANSMIVSQVRNACGLTRLNDFLAL